MSLNPITEETKLHGVETEEIQKPSPAWHEKIYSQPIPDNRGCSLAKRLKYEISLGSTLFTSPSWWSKIEPYNLYLGGLPLKKAGHLEKIKELGVTRVICVVEDFELKGWINLPVQKADWEEHGIQVHLIPAVDFLPLTRNELEKGIAILETLLGEGHVVYIHCKAGVGRSASIVVAYLMKHQGISLEEAIAFVKEHRPQINLNPAQRQGILDFFGKEKPIEEPSSSYLEAAQSMSQEALSKLLVSTLDYVIEGGTYAKLESTLSRKNRYLREFNGDQEAAVTAAISRSHSMGRKLVNQAIGFVPFVGIPTSYSLTLWHQLREIALIAALYGHDLQDPQVKMKILGSLIDADVMKIPAQSVDLIAKRIMKTALLKAGLSGVPGISLPAHLIFNYFTDNAAKVSTYAKATFGGDHSIAIPEKE